MKRIPYKTTDTRCIQGYNKKIRRGTNTRGDAQIAPMIKAPRAAQTILGLQENQDPSNPTKILTTRKSCALGKYIKLNNQDKKAPEKACTWRALKANSSSSKDSTRKGLKKKNVFKKVAERTWTNIH